MRYEKPKIETVRRTTHVIQTAHQKGFELIFDNLFRFFTATAYEADE